jgi:asparagine synthase (glutamine-hydrolysing)
MILDGQRAAQQVSRRRELIRGCGFIPSDITIRATGRPPLHPAGQRFRGCPVSPYDEPYHEAMSALHQAAAENGVRHVFTGIGGDEMVAVSRTEGDAAPVGSDRDFMPWISGRTQRAAEEADDGIAPASLINEMTMIAVGCAAPIVLTSGSWPVHPLADPRMITFGEWLPKEWRHGKRLHRERLMKRGLGHHVAYPPVPEVFTGIMDLGLRNHGMELARRLVREGGYLIDAGYVDAIRLAESCDRISAGVPLPRDREIFDVLALEVAIAALTGGPSATTVATCS